MYKEKIEKIIKNEKLTNFNLFEEHPIKENEVVIQKGNGRWEVFSTSERASKEGIKEFQNEDDALKDFIERLRAKNKVLEYFKNKGI